MVKNKIISTNRTRKKGGQIVSSLYNTYLKTPTLNTMPRVKNWNPTNNIVKLVTNNTTK
jgi:hypothetical protein